MDWNSVLGVVFDLDGTLYRQAPVRMRMARKLLQHAVSERKGWRDFRMLQHFRKNREALAESCPKYVRVEQYAATARAFGVGTDTVATVVHRWMEVAPLEMLRSARYRDIDIFFATLRARGIRIGVLSDYPVEAKLSSLGLQADAVCCSTEPDVDCLKPGTAGLKKLLDLLHIEPSECVLIGDRMERDGVCAQSLNVRFLLCNGRDFYSSLLSDVTGN